MGCNIFVNKGGDFKGTHICMDQNMYLQIQTYGTSKEKKKKKEEEKILLFRYLKGR